MFEQVQNLTIATLGLISAMYLVIGGYIRESVLLVFISLGIVSFLHLIYISIQNIRVLNRIKKGEK